MKLKRLALSLAVLTSPALALANWAPYIGVGGGWQYLQETTSITNVPYFGAYDTGSLLYRNYPLDFQNYNPTGVVSLFAGIGNTFSNGVYTAAEFDAYYSPATYTSNSQSFSYDLGSNYYLNTNHRTTFSMPWRFGVSGILGYHLTSSIMPYARLGLSGGRFYGQYLMSSTNNIPDSNATVGVNNATDGFMYGGTIGLGSRLYLTDNWFISLEGDYTRFFNYNQSTQPTYYNQNGPQVEPSTSYQDYQYQYQTGIWTLTASLAYQF